MLRSLPPLNALRAFEAAARLGSFKAAAHELGVTHGAISQHVRLLENWLRAPLFERYNRGVGLTSAARAYLAEVSPAFDQVAAATERYGHHDGTVIRVNAPATFALRWLVPRLTKFQQEYPDVKIRLETSNKTLESLGEDNDIIIRGGPDSFYGYSVCPFLSEVRLPVCSPTLLDRLPLRALRDLERHTLLHTSSLPRLWDEWLGKAGVAALRPQAVLVLDHFYLTLQAALDGIGIAMGPSALVSDDLAQRRLVTPFSGPSLQARSYCAYVPERQEGGELAVAFRSWLEREGNLAKEERDKTMWREL